MEAVIPVEAIKVMALVNETELYNNYVPFCANSHCVKDINRLTKVVSGEMNFPVITNREALFVGEGIDRLR
jgi:ribosome-associated toxin RatA of RatAB toxin-antitoxin module